MRKSASVHSLRTQIPLQIKMYSLLSIPESHFAQQLTYIDKVCTNRSLQQSAEICQLVEGDDLR